MQKSILIITILLSFVYKPLMAMERNAAKTLLTEYQVAFHESYQGLANLMELHKQTSFNSNHFLVAGIKEILQVMRILIEGGCHKDGKEWEEIEISKKTLKKLKKNSNLILKKAQKEIQNFGTDLDPPANIDAREFYKELLKTFESSLKQLNKFEKVRKK